MSTPASLAFKACSTKIRNSCNQVLAKVFKPIVDEDYIKAMIIATRRERVLAHVKARSNARFARALCQEHQKLHG